MRGLFFFLLQAIASPATSQAAEVSFRMNIGEEVFEINCSTNQARIEETRVLAAVQELEINRLRRLRQVKGLVEGENLLLLSLQFKIGFIRQNLAILEFGQHYCVRQSEIPSLTEINLEEVLMKSD